MEARDPPALVPALLALTFVAGIVDAVSFLALGQVFTANMTGNVALLGFATLPEVRLSVPRSACALALFFLGAVGGGRLEAWMARARKPRGIGAAFAAEAILVAAAAALAWGAGPRVESQPVLYADISLLAFAMGLRNATVRSLGIRDVTTTVLTLTLADLGRGAAAGRADRRWWHRGAASVVLMAAGAAIGALLLRASACAALAVAASVAAACAGAVAFTGAKPRG